MQLYHLALGAGADPMNPRELSYLVDNTPQVLPTFGNVAQSFHLTEPPTVPFPGIDIELAKILHGAESVTVAGPIPPAATARSTSRVVDIWDKGKAAVILTESAVTHAGRHTAVDHDPVDLRPRRGRIRRRARALDVVGCSRPPVRSRGAAADAAAAGAAVPAVR